MFNYATGASLSVRRLSTEVSLSVRRLSTEVLRQKTLEQHGPVIHLANRKVSGNYKTSP